MGKSVKNIGRVKWFDNKKGFGFIVMDDDQDKSEYFVHFSNIISKATYKSLEENQEVTFDLEKTAKGIQAVNVEVI